MNLINKVILLFSIIILLSSCNNDNQYIKKGDFIVTDFTSIIENKSMYFYYKIKVYDVPNSYTISGNIINCEIIPIVNVITSSLTDSYSNININKIGDKNYHIKIDVTNNITSAFLIKIKVYDYMNNNHLDNFFLEYIDEVGNKETIPLKTLN